MRGGHVLTDVAPNGKRGNNVADFSSNQSSLARWDKKADIHWGWWSSGTCTIDWQDAVCWTRKDWFTHQHALYALWNPHWYDVCIKLAEFLATHLVSQMQDPPSRTDSTSWSSGFPASAGSTPERSGQATTCREERRNLQTSLIGYQMLHVPATVHPISPLPPRPVARTSSAFTRFSPGWRLAVQPRDWLPPTAGRISRCSRLTRQRHWRA